MKKTFICAAFILVSCLGVHAQTSDSVRQENNRITIRKARTIPPSQYDSPLYVLTADDKSFQIPENGNLRDSVAIANTLKYLNPQWIESINVLKGKDATDMYSALGQNGVILIYLKKESMSEMPLDFREKFKDN